MSLGLADAGRDFLADAATTRSTASAEEVVLVGGSTATIERGRAEAIQVNGDPEGGSTATIRVSSNRLV